MHQIMYKHPDGTESEIEGMEDIEAAREYVRQLNDVIISKLFREGKPTESSRNQIYIKVGT